MSAPVLLLHTALSTESGVEDRDVLVQAEAVESALRRLGRRVERLPCSLNLEHLVVTLRQLRPSVVFNLVESVGGSDGLAHLIPAVLEYLHIPFTGSGTNSLQITNDKLRTKIVLGDQLRPVRIPEFALANDSRKLLGPPKKFILKAIREHASVGIDDAAIITAAPRDLPRIIAEHSRRIGRECFAEEFIAGREFNLSLLANGGSVQVLPPAEIDFSTFPVDKPRIVGYDAKWSETSFEFVNTPRRFDLPPEDDALVQALARAAAQCWGLLDLKGYVRVDFRVDPAGVPYLLEVNTNPCLSPDAGFAAALEAAGIDFTTAVERILADAFRGDGLGGL